MSMKEVAAQSASRPTLKDYNGRCMHPRKVVLLLAKLEGRQIDGHNHLVA